MMQTTDYSNRASIEGDFRRIAAVRMLPFQVQREMQQQLLCNILIANHSLWLKVASIRILLYFYEYTYISLLRLNTVFYKQQYNRQWNDMNQIISPS